MPPVAAELVAVRDLDLVDDDCWPQALAMLARPPLRDALTAPVRVLLPDGVTETVRPYTAWWLRGHPVLDGRRPAGLRAAGGDPLLEGLYEEARRRPEASRDAQVLRALGVRTSAAALLEEPGGAAELLGRLADPDSAGPTPAQLHGLYGLLADARPRRGHAARRAARGARGRRRGATSSRRRSGVADAPDLVPLAGRPGAAARTARAAPAGWRRCWTYGGSARWSPAARCPVERARSVRCRTAVRALLPGAPATYREHEELLVDGTDAGLAPYTRDGTLHAATLEGVAAGLAWAAGQWARRFEVAALLEDPTRAEELARARWHE